MQLTKTTDSGAGARGWRDDIRLLRDISDRCDVLQKRTPAFYGKLRHRLQRLEQSRVRIAIAGAQGVGKSTLVSACLASPGMPEPPVPVSEREETRVPIVCRWSSMSRYREIRERSEKLRAGRLTADQVRHRASADRRFFDPSKYKGLLALELEDPDFPLEPHVDLVDLPGVSGNLAGVSEWAQKYLLEEATQALVFVVGSGQTIDCTEDEANLIRAFGPLMVRSIFVQNVWPGYGDDVEGTREGNLSFLQEHIGREAAAHYFLVDCKAAFDGAREDDKEPLREVMSSLRPLLEVDKAQVVEEEANRLAAHLDHLFALVSAERLAAEGRVDEAQRIRAKLADDRAALERVLAGVHTDVDAERKPLHARLRSVVASALGKLEIGISTYIEGDRTLTQKLLEREVSRLLGASTRTIMNGSSEAIEAGLGRVQKLLEERLVEALNVQASPDAEVELGSLDLPEIELESVRRALRLVTTLSSSALGLAGAGIGAYIGTLGGPIGGIVGSVVGGVVGGILGWLGSKAGHSYIEIPIAKKQRASIMKALREPLTKARDEAVQSLCGVADRRIDELWQRIEAQVLARAEALGDDDSREAASKDARSLRVDLSILDGARKRLKPILDGGP